MRYALRSAISDCLSFESLLKVLALAAPMTNKQLQTVPVCHISYWIGK